MIEPSFKEQFERCEEILKELLAGEFKDIKEEVELFVGRTPRASGTVYWGPKLRGKPVIILSIEHWSNTVSKYYGTDEFSYKKVTQTLRHELLHLLTGKKDGDLEFITEATRRGIELKGDPSMHTQTFIDWRINEKK